LKEREVKFQVVKTRKDRTIKIKLISLFFRNDVNEFNLKQANLSKIKQLLYLIYEQNRFQNKKMMESGRKLKKMSRGGRIWIKQGRMK